MGALLLHSRLTATITFGNGEDGAAIAWPDPRLCNLHLAVAWVFAASGFVEVIDKIFWDYGEDEAPVRFMDDLSRRLFVLSVLVEG